MNFKIGQRVRIVGACLKQNRHNIGREATIVAAHGKYHAPLPGYGIAVDGVLPPPFHEFWVAIPEHLAPLTNPDESAWNEFKSRHLTPDPAIILAKEPA